MMIINYESRQSILKTSSVRFALSSRTLGLVRSSRPRVIRRRRGIVDEFTGMIVRGIGDFLA